MKFNKKSDHAVSAILGTILVLTIIITAISLVFATIFPQIDQVNKRNMHESFTNQLDALDYR